MAKNLSSHINLENARDKEQREIMEKLKKDKICPFCEEGLRRCSINPPVLTRPYWILTTNHWPYDFTQHHFIAVHRKHIENVREISPKAWNELLSIFRYIEKHFRLKGGAIGIRFGDVTKTGATIGHLHAHLIVADTDTSKSGYKRVRFPMGPKPAL